MIKDFRFLFLMIALIFLSSCSQQNVVEEYFQSHGMSYPIDASGMTVLDVEYVGIEEGELLAPGAREHVKSGITFTKKYFQSQDLQRLIPGARAIALNSPVFFRDESGSVGLMVKVTAYGQGKPNDKNSPPVKWLGSDRQLWRKENFAYFSWDYGYRKWSFNGWVY